jgi:hypothetical protein
MVANVSLDIIGLTFQPGHLLSQEVKLFAFLANMTDGGFFKKVCTFFDLVGVFLQGLKRGFVK